MAFVTFGMFFNLITTTNNDQKNKTTKRPLTKTKHTMNTYHIIMRETGYGIAKKLNGQGFTTSIVVDTVEGTLEDAGRVLLDRLRANELNVDGDTYYSQLSHGKMFAAFTVGECHCECYEYDCEYIIASQTK